MQQARLRLAAGAAIGIDMAADLESIYGQFLLQLRMQNIKIFTSLLAGRDIRLIGDHNVQKSVLAQTAQCRGNPGQQFEFRNVCWCVGFAVTHQ